MIALRDPFGVRFSHWQGRRRYVVLVNLVLRYINAQYIRASNPADGNHQRTDQVYTGTQSPEKVLCFRIITFSRPDIYIYNHTFQYYTQEFGKQLAIDSRRADHRDTVPGFGFLQPSALRSKAASFRFRTNQEPLCRRPSSAETEHTPFRLQDKT